MLHCVKSVYSDGYDDESVHSSNNDVRLTSHGSVQEGIGGRTSAAVPNNGEGTLW